MKNPPPTPSRPDVIPTNIPIIIKKNMYSTEKIKTPLKKFKKIRVHYMV
ncbi:MAG: hypothetical protein LBU74_01440 [Methanobacteriaceae archaeon]|jgi:hypothetical protein|nr:hypothetical protein [Candidatus Methanorudis spinitermitis]